MKVECTCAICDSTFQEYKVRVEQGRGKYCSTPCYRLSRKGKPAWNKGIPAPWAIGNQWRKGKTNLKPHKAYSVDNPQWKGVNVGYRALHLWVERQLGHPRTCSVCGDNSKPRSHYHWANKSRRYLRNVHDWIRLCAKCHKHHDAQ